MDPLIGGLILGGGILNAYGQLKAGQANAAAARFNAKLAYAAADDALQRGEQRVWRVRMTTERRIGAQKVAYGASGVDVSSGTPASVVGQTAMVGELDALTERNNAYRQAWGYQMQGRQFEMAASAAEQMGKLNAIASLIGPAAKVFGG